MNHTLFSTFVHQSKLKISTKTMGDIKKTALKLPELDIAGAAWSKKNYRNGYTSYGSLSTIHKQFSVFETLKKQLDCEVLIYTKKLGLKFESGHLSLSSLWVNVMPKNCYHAFHAHPLSVISGTFYVQAPKNSSPLRLEDPRASLFMACPARKIQHDIKPKTGEVVLFESWMKHEVPLNASNETRVSVSFNYDWVDR